MTRTSLHLRVLHSGGLDSFVREIVQRGAAVTRSRLHLDGDQLSADELRGYVRARAIGPVRLLADQFAVQRGLSLEQADQLAARALERTVYTVVRDMFLRPIVAGTTLSLPLRAAA